MEICYLARGTQNYWVKDRNHHLVGGDVFITFPAEPHSTGGCPLEKGILYWMHIDMKAEVPLLNLPEEDSCLIKEKLLAIKNRHFHES
jgi:hypothetical protein